MMIKLTKCFLLYILLVCGLQACKTKKLAQIKSAAIDSAQATINFQAKREYRFNQGKILFNNKFAGARMNLVTQINDSTFNLAIEPENSPINPSPWYAFKVWSATAKNLYINLIYSQTIHRYNPKVYQGNLEWKDLGEVKLSPNKKKATFKVASAKDTVLIAGQELISSADDYKWEDSLAKLRIVRKQIIGHSLLGKPIHALNIGESNGKKLIVVLSRQHPPEVTGYLAMQEFVRTIIAPTTLAQNFRKQYELVLIPLINPDGVDEGNWRHSAAGVDLNRDWELFVQPETRSIRDYLFKKIDSQKAKVYFGIDFHSTYHDVFYTNEDQPLNKTNIPGFTNEWLEALKIEIPGFKPNVKPSPNGGNVSKSWMGRVLRAEALTYEVGDDTPRSTLKSKGRAAAETMMRLLLARVTN
jgi:hypothetical protein